MAATHPPPPSMEMWLTNQDEFDHLTPEGYTNINAFSTPDDPESRSPVLAAEDPFSKYSDDPPALIACVAFLSDRSQAMANPLVQRDGGYWERENDGKRSAHPVYHSRTLTNTTVVRESSKQVPSTSRSRPQLLHIRDSRV